MPPRSKPDGPPAYSVSSLIAYERCPWMYYYTYVLGRPPPRSPAMARGTSIHKLIADHFRQRPLLPPEEPIAGMLATFERSRFNRPAVAIEKPFRLPFPQGLVRGRIDLVLPDEPGLELVDFKSGTVRGREQISSHLQLPLYTLAAAQLFDQPAGNLRYTYFYLQDGSEVSFETSPAQFESLEARVEGILTAIQAGRFDPAPGCTCYACTARR